MHVLSLLAAAADLADPVTVIATVFGAALTALTGVQTSQMSGLRADFHAYRDAQDKRVSSLEGKLEHLQGQFEQLADDSGVAPTPRRRKATGSQSTTKGRRTGGPPGP